MKKNKNALLKTPFSKIFLWSSLLLIAIPLTFLVVTKGETDVEASTKDGKLVFPRLGQTTARSENYEKASLTSTISTQVFNTQSEHTEVFSPPASGFFIGTDNSEDIEKMTFIATKVNGDETDLLQLHESDLNQGIKAKGQQLAHSDLYTFDSPLAEVKIFFPEGIKLEVYAISPDTGVTKDGKKYNPPGVKPVNIDNPAFYASANAEKAFRKQVFSALGINIITRDEWGVTASSEWNPPEVLKPNRIIVHHTATSSDNPKQVIKMIHDYHYSLGWSDIGYNYIIDAQGNIYEGRAGGNGVRGAHAGNDRNSGQNANYNSVGIAILGDYTSQEPTQASMESLTRLIAAVSSVNDFEPLWHNNQTSFNTASDPGIYGHRDVKATGCPGSQFYDNLPAVSSLAAQYRSTYSPMRNTLLDIRGKLVNKEYVKTDTDTDVFVDLTSLSADVKEKVLTNSRGVTAAYEYGGYTIFKVKNELVEPFIAELELISPNAKPQPNYIYHPSDWDNTDPNRSIPNDYDITTHWNLEKTKQPEAWKALGGCSVDTTCGGDSTVTVAVLDTGVAYENYTFDPGTDSTYTRLKFLGLYIEYPTTSTPDGTFVNTTNYEGYERVYEQAPELSGITFVAPKDYGQDYLCYLRSLDPLSSRHCNTEELNKINHGNDDNGHGTAVTSVIAANTGNLPGVTSNRVVGSAHNVQIMPVKIFLPNDTSMCQTSGGAYDPTCSDPNYDYRSISASFLIANGIQHAIDSGADVINLSVGGGSYDSILESKINAATAAGIIIVASSGNTGGSTMQYPAAYSKVISVGATAQDDTRATYSTYGSLLDLVAPVGNLDEDGPAAQSYNCFTSGDCSDETVQSLFDGASMSSDSTPIGPHGTSFAAPQVSAAAALLKSVRTDTLSFAQYKDLITTSTTDVGTSGYDTQTGRGIIDINKLIDTATNAFSINTGYTCGTNCWNIYSASEPVSGDFDNDGDDDLAIMYQYGDNSAKLWIFVSDGAGNFTPEIQYSCGAGCFELSKATNLVAGDFDNDGDDDVAVLYQNSSYSVDLRVFKSNGLGSFTEETQFTCGPGCWNIDNTSNLAAGDFDNDGDDDIVTMYQYSKARIKVWQFTSDGLGSFSSDVTFTCGTGCWYIKQAGELVAGDFNSDLKDDFIVMYQYPKASIKIWQFTSDGLGSFTPATVFSCGAGCWNKESSTNIVAGDFNNDSKVDFSTMYQYPSASIRIWTFTNNGDNTFTEKRWFYCDGGCWYKDSATNLASGNFLNDSRPDIVTIYQYPNYAVKVWTFPAVIYP